MERGHNENCWVESSGMTDIILSTLNARYIHASFGLRYLLANMGELRSRSRILEFNISNDPQDVARTILAESPRIVGLGIYIWNRVALLEVAGILKKLDPELVIVLGGPEMCELAQQPIVDDVNHIIIGEGDLRFAALCRQILEGDDVQEKVITAGSPELDRLILPYDLYSEEDIDHRIIYVESSRGCPYQCEYCYSGGGRAVRYFDLAVVLPEFEKLLGRGVRHFKFVDRSFNLRIDRCIEILQFFLANYQPGLRLHFELVPDRLPERFRAVIQLFPAGALHFEVGIQSYNDEVTARIRRRMDAARTDDNIRFLVEDCGADIHVDLIAGLPGESLASFAAGFDRLVALRPDEIQLGILKQLPGTAILRHTMAWGMNYNLEPPYDIIENSLIDAAAMVRIKRFARYWELLYNRGNFEQSVQLLWEDSGAAFDCFMLWSDWLYNAVGRTHAIPLMKLCEYLFRYLTEELHLDAARTAKLLWQDYSRNGKRPYPPPCLRPHI